MEITYQESNGKIYFILPMIRLEMEKLINDKYSKSKEVESTPKTFDDAIPDMAFDREEEDQIVGFYIIENPPLAKDCKSEWGVEERKQCTVNFIIDYLVNELNTELASELGLYGRVRIVSEFVIDTNGKGIDVKASGSHRVMNEHVLEIIKSLPDFRPGTINEKPTKVSHRIPVNFVVEH